MRLGSIIGVSLQTELLVLSFLGIICCTFDVTTTKFNENLTTVQQLKMDEAKFTATSQLYIKFFLSCLVRIRTVAVYTYLASYFIILYPLITERHPRWILPWLSINFAKCFIIGPISLYISLYISLRYKFLQPACWEFFATYIMVHAPSIYMFCQVRSFYKDLRKLMQIMPYCCSKREDIRCIYSCKRISCPEASRRDPEKEMSCCSVKLKPSFFTNGPQNFRGKVSKSVDAIWKKFRCSQQDRDLEVLMSKNNALTLEERTCKILEITTREVSQSKTKQTEDELRLVTEKLRILEARRASSTSSTSPSSSTSTSEDNEYENEESDDSDEEIDSCFLIAEKYVSDSKFRGNFSPIKNYQDACLQAETPDLDVLNLPHRNLSGHTKRSTLTEPTQLREVESTFPDAMEGNVQEAKTEAKPLKPLYQNRLAIRYYRDDGYTQDFRKRNRQSF